MYFKASAWATAIGLLIANALIWSVWMQTLEVMPYWASLVELAVNILVGMVSVIGASALFDIARKHESKGE